MTKKSRPAIRRSSKLLRSRQSFHLSQSIRNRQLSLEEWTSDPALETKLGAEASYESFFYRFPSELKFRGGGGNARSHCFVWEGEPRGDKSAATITLLTGRLYPAIKNVPLEQAAADQLKTDQQRFRDVVPGKSVSGTINGIPFYKTTFTMVDPKNSLPGRATVYHGHLGEHYFHLMYHDVEPHLTQTEKLLEAAALSVRTKP